MNKTYTILFLVITCLLPALTSIAQSPDEMFRGNPAHNKNYTAPGDKIFNKVAWTFKTGAAVRSTAIIVMTWFVLAAVIVISMR